MFKNTFADIEPSWTRPGEANGTRFEFECYDTGHIHTCAISWIAGWSSRRCSSSSCSACWAASARAREPAAHEAHCRHAVRATITAVLGAGRGRARSCAWSPLSAVLGGHVRVGLEDSLTSTAARWRSRTPSRSPRSAADRGAVVGARQPGRSARDAGPQGRRRPPIFLCPAKGAVKAMRRVVSAPTITQHFMVNGTRRAPARKSPRAITGCHAAAREAGHEFSAPDDHGIAPVAAVHTAEYLHFLRTITPAGSGSKAPRPR